MRWTPRSARAKARGKVERYSKAALELRSRSGTACRAPTEDLAAVRRGAQFGERTANAPSPYSACPAPAGLLPGSPQFSCRYDWLCGRACLGSAHRAPLLEAFAAVDGTSLGRLEGNCRFFATLRANGFGFDALDARRTCAVARRAVCFACFAPLRLVLEVFVMEEVLFSRREYEFCRAVYTLEYSVLKLRHNLCPVAYQ